MRSPGVQRGFSVGLEIRKAMSQSQQGRMDDKATQVRESLEAFLADQQDD